MVRFAPVFLLLGLVGCGPQPPSATLPADAVQGSGDPTRTTILSSAYVFNSPAALAGNPAAAARALAGMEYLAAEIPIGPRWIEYTPQVTFELRAARAEWRQVLGIPPDALPQPVVDSLFAVARGAACQGRYLALGIRSPISGGSARSYYLETAAPDSSAISSSA